jgi:SAM-dependent methyltransferase
MRQHQGEQPTGMHDAQIMVADARALPIDDAAADLVLTSPPYCTRIDYAISTSFELAVMGIGGANQALETLRRASMGSPLARRGQRPGVPNDWPRRVKELLAAIANHQSKASYSYYYKTYWQYFADAHVALREIARCLRPGGAAVLVVQTSNYKDIFVDLPELYIDIGAAVGLEGSTVSVKLVRRALSQINPGAQRHRASPSCREAVICLEKP